MISENSARSGQKLGFLPLIWVLFSVVAGGPYGIEEAIPDTGPGLGLLLIILIPFVWSIPISLMTAELASAIPVEGGYICWIGRALGPFWSFLSGWLSWIRNMIDASLYPVLFVGYLPFLLSDLGWPHPLSPLAKWLIAFALVAFFAFLNLKGIKIVGDSTSLLCILVLVPFVLMVFLSLLGGKGHSPWVPFLPPGKGLMESFGAGLLIIIWNYNGWEDFTPCLGEVQNPRRVFPRALMVAVPLIIGVYFFSTLAALYRTSDWASWTSGSFAAVGKTIAGGAWLGIWLSIAVMLGTASQLSTMICACSRIPSSLAEQGLLPGWFGHLHPRTGVPWVSVAVCSALISLFCVMSFQDLVTIDIFLYFFLIVAEFISFAVLKVKAPTLTRPINMPLGLWGAILLAIPPGAIIVLSILKGPAAKLPLFGAVVLSGVLVYWAHSRRKRE